MLDIYTLVNDKSSGNELAIINAQVELTSRPIYIFLLVVWVEI